MEYLTIYRPYELTELITKAKEGKNGEAETKNWNTTLNDYAEKKYKVINSGTFVAGGYVYFWAILEK